MIWHSILIVILTVIFAFAAYALSHRKPARRYFIRGRQVQVSGIEDHNSLVWATFDDTGEVVVARMRDVTEL